MGSLSIWHWLIVAVIVALVFGTKKLRGAGRDLGEAVRGFKEGAMGVGGPTEAEAAAAKTKAEATTSATSSTSSVPSSDVSPR